MSDYGKKIDNLFRGHVGAFSENASGVGDFSKLDFLKLARAALDEAGIKPSDSTCEDLENMIEEEDAARPEDELEDEP